MTEKINSTLRESPVARWIALLLVASTMFFAYMFADVLAPLSSMLETQLNWSPAVFGTVGGAEFFLNVFVFFLILAGIILDKLGVRFTAVLSGTVMVIGASIKLYGISLVEGDLGYSFFNSFLPDFPASAKIACIGFAIFGCGVEMAGITVSKAIVKWFKGKELALAMGLEMALARLGVFTVFRLSPYLASSGSITKPVMICTLFLLIGLLTFTIYFFLDRKLDRQEGVGAAGSDPEEEFKVSDIKSIITSKTFWIVAGLCVLFYSAIFPFQKFATGMLTSRLSMEPAEAAGLFSFFPIGAMILTPLLGWFLDTKGKGATMLMIGALLMSVCHTIFALTPGDSFTYSVAITAIVILGVSFSLVPAALWPSVPKLVDNKVLGSAYSIIFWIQNIGLMATPAIIGAVLQSTNPGVAEQIAAGDLTAKYNYTVPMLLFASLGIFAFLLGVLLKRADKKKGYGLELPNKKKK